MRCQKLSRVESWLTKASILSYHRESLPCGIWAPMGLRMKAVAGAPRETGGFDEAASTGDCGIIASSGSISEVCARIVLMKKHALAAISVLIAEDLFYSLKASG